jgi:putative transposase
MIGLTEYFAFYNIQRPHQSLGQIPPDVVYRSGIGGGAMILDKYLRTEKDKKSETEESKESPASDVRVEESAKTGQRRPAVSGVKCTA